MPASRDADKQSICSACGAEAPRGSAKYCLVCGKLLKEGYQPLDSLRSSYGLQRRDLGFNTPERQPSVRLFSEDRNAVSDTAWACVVYSMVPYLGILFVPFALLIGGYGYYVSIQKPHIGGRTLAVVSLAISLLVLAIQILLWWLLYIIPELGGI